MSDFKTSLHTCTKWMRNTLTNLINNNKRHVIKYFTLERTMFLNNLVKLLISGSEFCMVIPFIIYATGYLNSFNYYSKFWGNILPSLGNTINKNTIVK